MTCIERLLDGLDKGNMFNNVFISYLYIFYRFVFLLSFNKITNFLLFMKYNKIFCEIRLNKL